ncbi:hypothetical protein SAMN05216262_10226 [Colwellia chukchiensis]|uniref:BACON domain-containing protein n=1 Tax=Colwellia chukchiensis TaxID=641665 RepID=A0A1H7IRT8_9GAMM|nr:hypothetical protein [Colwellia chukchiensis]SEK65004.1 hypothetical protein SAMN05216262_10226 [Colwellia chukchiensis]
MTGQINNMRLILVILFSSLFLQACGGSDEKAPVYSVSTSISSVAFTNEFLQQETHSISIEVNFDGNGLLLGFAPTANPVSWLEYRVENLTDNSATIHIDVVNAHRVAPDLYATTLRLSSGDTTTTNLAHADINVSLLVWQMLSFADTYGVDSIASKSIQLSASEDNLTLTSSVPWLNVEKSFADGVTTILATPKLSDLTSAGLYAGTIDITSPLGTTSYPVELALDNIHLFADSATIALAETANISNKQTTIHINSNSVLPWGWQASTDANWLTLTPSPETNQLTILVDSTNLANNSTSLASISITPNQQTTAIGDTINVSFYKSDKVTENTTLELDVNNNGIVIDPLLPQYYVATSNELRSYHLYSNELLSTTVIAPEETLLEQLIIHPDASMLLAKAVETKVVDEDTNEIITHRYQIDLADMSVVELDDVNINSEPVKFIRIDGRYFVTTSILEYADQNLNRLGFNNANAFLARAFNVAEQTQNLFALDISTPEEQMSIKRIKAKVNDFGRIPITTEISHSYRPELLAETDQISDFFVTADEKDIYAISPTSQWISFNGDTFTDNGVLTSDEAITNLALAYSKNDRPHYVRFEAEQGFKIDVYNQQQTIANSIDLGTKQPSQLLIANGDSRALLPSAAANSIDVITLSQFSSSADTLLFSSNFGDTNIPQQELILANIGAGWQATASAPWLILTTQSDENGESILIDIDESLITGWGLMTASITIFDPESGTTKVITVELAIDAIRLSSNYPALAFNSLATEQTLTHTVNILSNSESNIAWQANTDVNWLSLAADADNNTLTITGVPANIPTDGLHTAVITLSSIDADAALSGSINVTFNKGADDSTDIDISDISYNNAGIVLDPMRPYVYIASGDKLNTYHVITGALVNSTASPLANVDLTHLVIHPDGSMLLASNSESYFDEDGNEQSRVNHYQFDLSTYQFNQIDSDLITIEYRPIMIKMVAGAPVVITQTLEFADLNLVRQYWDRENTFFASTIAQASNTDLVMALNPSTTSLERFKLTYNAYASDMVTAIKQPSYVNSAFTNLAAFALSANGLTIYTANSVSEWAVFDGSNYTDNGLLHGNANVQTFNTTIDTSDNSYYYRFDPNQGLTYSKYNGAQVELWSEVIASGSAESYLMPDFQRLLIYDAATATLSLRSHP